MVEQAPQGPPPRPGFAGVGSRRTRWRPLKPRQEFFRRFASYALASAALIGGALLIGALGYHVTEKMRWIDAVYTAAMILTGMGPTEPLKTDAGKIFATGYALVSALVFFSAATLLLAPVVKRFLHRFHLEFEDDSPQPHG